MKIKIFQVFLFLPILLFGQRIQQLEINKEYENIIINTKEKKYHVYLAKNKKYEFLVLQQGIDVEISLKDTNDTEIVKMDSPNGAHGYEKFEYKATSNAKYTLLIKPFKSTSDSKNKTVSIQVRLISKSELKRRESIRKELMVENEKNVQTLDIDHFWEAFDNLKNCKTKKDSIDSFQKIYIDRATSGLKEFIRLRPSQFTPKMFVTTIAKYPKFYNSIRKNTFKVKEAEPLIEEVFQNFSKIYSNFKPFKVCFAIGTVGTGGTISSDFVLIGTEISTSTENIDLSEFEGKSIKNSLAFKGDVVQKLKNIVSHECVHTQQRVPLDKNAVKCHLLRSCLREGAADFIGELVAGGQINESMQQYGDANENDLWNQFKSELCNTNHGGWLYNYSEVKNKPADLGYYIGYKIAQEYYKNAKDKNQAIIEIIEINNPFKYLEKSGYDKKLNKM